jgi:sugar-specific transcriptional regulator TrmB
MSSAIDLTPFGFTPTESLIYEVLLRSGPGTGYTIARAAGLARANVYAALEGLVTKGGARASEERPRHYRPESPSTLLAQLSERQGAALDRLSQALATLTAPDTSTLVELTSARAAVQLMGREIARAQRSVSMVAPPDGCLALAPQLRRAAAIGVSLDVASTGPVPLGSVTVTAIDAHDWPGEPVLLVVDDHGALIGSRATDTFSGHWGHSAGFVAAAHQALLGLKAAT